MAYRHSISAQLCETFCMHVVFFQLCIDAHLSSFGPSFYMANKHLANEADDCLGSEWEFSCSAHANILKQISLYSMICQEGWALLLTLTAIDIMPFFSDPYSSTFPDILECRQDPESDWVRAEAWPVPPCSVQLDATCPTLGAAPQTCRPALVAWKNQ